MIVEMLQLSEINPAPYNPRVDLEPTDPEYIKIKRSIQTFGCVEPLVINKDNTLIGGHQRLKAMKDLGYAEAPVVRVDFDKPHEQALNIALNRITGRWDVPKLADLIKSIYNIPDVNVNLTGFSSSTIDGLLHEVDVSFFFTTDPLDVWQPKARKPLVCPFCGEEITEVKE